MGTSAVIADPPRRRAAADEWTDEVRAELEQLVDREVSMMRSRIPHEHLVRQRFNAPAA